VPLQENSVVTLPGGEVPCVLCSPLQETLKIFSPFPEKPSLPWNFPLYWRYFSSFRIFEQLALALKNRVALKIFTVNIFYHSGFWSNLRLPWKQSLSWIHCSEYIFFIIQDFWATCACPENRVCPKNFKDRGAAAPPRAPRSPASYANAYSQIY